MFNHFKRIAALAFATAILSTSCTETTTTQEQTEINKIDSSQKAVKENTDKLEAQTNKVEASLEKLDAEFKQNN